MKELRVTFVLLGVTIMFLGMIAYTLRWLWVAMIAVSALIYAYSAARADDELVDPTPQEYADIQSWISSSCCWTNNCCKKVRPSALTPLGNDEWRVEATGQVRKRTGWSRDGNTWRCTCDYLDGKWVVHPKANTRCIFPVANGS